MFFAALFFGSVLLLFVATSWSVPPPRDGDKPADRQDDTLPDTFSPPDRRD